MRFPITAAALLGAALAPAVAASDISVPSGFNIESVPAAGPVFGQLPDGRLLLSTGSFGADELSTVEPDGSLRLWATGFGSAAGLAVSDLSGDIVVGDSFFSPALVRLRDLNGDGDVLDAGEHLPYGVDLPVLANGAAPLPFDLAFAPGTDTLFVSGSTPFGVEPTLGVVVRCEGVASAVFAEGLGFAADLAWDGATLLVADLDASTFVGRVVALADGNGDDDALDPGEAVDFASGLSGASGLVRAADGSFYLSGMSDPGDFSGCVGRLLPDLGGDGVSDGLEECVFDGFPFAGGLVLVEGPGGFVPGLDGEGTLYVGDFTFAGARTIRSAPHAGTAVDGVVGPDQLISVRVSGSEGAGAFFAISLDTDGVTVGGVGDLGFGFGGPTVFSGVAGVDASGQASWDLLLRSHPALLGEPVVFQGFTVEGDAFGIGNPLTFVFGE